MAALLRSGKFLRLVTGIARQNPTPGGATQVNQGQAKYPDTTSHQGSTDSHYSFQSWSLHQLQGALPILSSNSSNDNLEEYQQTDHLKLKEFLMVKHPLPAEENTKGPVANKTLPELKSGEKKKLKHKTLVKKSLKSEVIGFDAIKEEDESVSVAQKTVVVSRLSPKKDHHQAVAEQKTPVDNKPNYNETLSTKAETKESQKTPLEVSQSPPLEQSPIPPRPQADIPNASLNLQPDQVTPTPVQTLPEKSGQTIEEILPSESFVPMVQVVDAEVTNWYPLHVVCSMFRSQGRISDLENLLMGAVGIRKEDRKMIFIWTLQAYADQGLFDNAIMLSRRLEWEGLSHDFPEFHSLMGNIIQNYSSPYYPSSEMSISQTVSPYPTSPSTPVSSCTDDTVSMQGYWHRKMKKAIVKENSQESLSAFMELEKTGKAVNVTELSTIVELLVKDDYLEDATYLAESMLHKDTYPMPKIFRFLLNRLASSGKVELMNRLGIYLSTEVKKEVSFDNRLCNAYLAAGRGKEYLDQMEIELDTATSAGDESQIERLKDKFPRGGAMGLLESDPKLIDQYTRVSEKFLQFNFIAPVNVLWTYHFINGRYDLATPLWEAYVKNCPQIMFQKVCQTARSTGNSELAWRLVDLLKTATVTQGARGIAYSCLIDVLAQQGSFEEGCEAIRCAQDNGVQLCDINRTALKRLKDGMESQSKKFPFVIPKKPDVGSDLDSEISYSTAVALCQ